MSYLVSIVGRPNVGKSTLFNRLVGKRKAIVHVKSGVTRDRIYGNSEWNGVTFSVVDTGGYNNKMDILDTEIRKQILIAVKESDVILFLIDMKIGLLDVEIEISQILRKYQKSILLIVNKVDNGTYMYHNTDFFRLGFSNYYFISAINGSGTGDMLDGLVEILKELEEKKIMEKGYFPRFSVIGRPNVGKSTLINSFLEKNHHIVTNISGTTRDSLDVFYQKFGYRCILVDTPGVRKRSKISESIDFYSTMRTVKTIEYTDICLLMVDAVRGWESQDRNIFRLVEKNQKGIIIIINKWDLLHVNCSRKKNFEIFIRKNIAPFDNVPILFVSAKNKEGINKIIPIAYHIFKIRKKKLKTNLLNRVMLPIFKINPPTYKKKLIKIKYCTQLPTSTPKFIFFSNYPQYIKESYKRFIENKIRYYFDFRGVPIRIFFRKK
ncbi:MAG: ribosome biogenesis GTPase Der [Flavobacteriales bacterium]|jgi:GTP-binding protein|uniref:ribosome biogenesis GTPase Der n=1 Tax=Blattabacterium sp. (Mastotermes darwiniensis) TaxID=39768 RepID=UPI000231DF88|nr:ribosome biogenesis GTPase Der [Blattabacterium sp. (Mastotermes darwiniensis)]AER40416.1 GTP-binding protein EngA [Blattabacterium sp. (Mastotermes darwiniensis) str. MADAR]MDR1804861.1 ribosome biogenesis GTPase Der [Flavobacteriales bacterium]